MSATLVSCPIHGVPLSYRTILGTTMSQPFCPICETVQAPPASTMTTSCGPDYYAFWLQASAELLDVKAENERLRASKQALVDKVKRLEDQVARLSPGFKP